MHHHKPLALLALPAWYAEQGLCNDRVSVCLVHRSTAAAACGGFAAERPADRTYRSTAAAASAQQHSAQQHGAQQQMPAVSC